jgi:hypothetical protein
MYMLREMCESSQSTTVFFVILWVLNFKPQLLFCGFKKQQLWFKMWFINHNAAL